MVPSHLPAAVVVWLDPRRPELGIKVVESVPDALCALHRHGLEDIIRGHESEAWISAAGALVRADVEPSPGNLQAAYEAFLRLAKTTAPVPEEIRRVVCPRGLHERGRSQGH